MSQIGQFTRTKSGYSGRVRTLTLDAEVVLVPADRSDADNAPDYRIHLGHDGRGPEIGAGWKRTGEKAGEYVSLLIDDPTLRQPIRACISGESRIQQLTLDATNRRGRPVRCTVTCTPLDGVPPAGVRGAIIVMENQEDAAAPA